MPIAHALRAEGFDASEDGTGRGTPVVPVCFSIKDHGADAETDLAPTLRAGGHDGSHANAGVPPAIAFDLAQITSAANRTRVGAEFPASTLNAKGDMHVAFNITPSNSNKDYNARASDCAQAVTAGGNRPSARGGDLIAGSAVRRLTPRECERLQGLPDDYTLIPWRKGLAPDGPRYKALGNSMAVPVMRWIGERIAAVEAAISSSHSLSGPQGEARGGTFSNG